MSPAGSFFGLQGGLVVVQASSPGGPGPRRVSSGSSGAFSRRFASASSRPRAATRTGSARPATLGSGTWAAGGVGPLAASGQVRPRVAPKELVPLLAVFQAHLVSRAVLHRLLGSPGSPGGLASTGNSISSRPPPTLCAGPAINLKDTILFHPRVEPIIFQNVVRLFATPSPWTVVHQAPLSMEFSRPEYWCGLPCPPPGDFSDPGIEPGSPLFFTVWEDRGNGELRDLPLGPRS